ncbi:MAG: SDR family NAD(P)-dependent oxidoreductase [Candidatus Hodarchaeales archaeon]|jgi:NAD(P)-dependent dehydrogenase (short-subunit alcohol dehydrogenase family)
MKNVLVTGASSGIGRAISEFLAIDYQVFAGVRQQKDFEELNEINNVIPLILDITDQSNIKAAFNEIESLGGLYSLINNAGIIVPGSLLEMDIVDLQKQFEINLFAPLTLIQTFFPLLRKSKGKIINIGSLNGFLISPISGGAYTMSKFGVEAMTEILIAELHKFDIQVCVVDPGQYQTSVFDKIKTRVQELITTTDYYVDEYEQILEALEVPEEVGRSTDSISELIWEILNTESLHSRYISTTEEEQKILYTEIVNRLLEMNKGCINNWSLLDLKGLIDG